MLIPLLMENDIKNLAEFNFFYARVVFPVDSHAFTGVALN